MKIGDHVWLVIPMIAAFNFSSCKQAGKKSSTKDVVEDIGSPAGIAYLYFVDDRDMVYQRECPPPPTSDWKSYPKNRDQCGKPVKRPERGPYPIATFRGALAQEYEKNQSSLNKDLESLKAQRSELKVQIDDYNKLIADEHTPESLRTSYRTMVAELGIQDKELEKQKNFDEVKLKEIGQSLSVLSDVIIKRMLGSKLVHPVVKGSGLFNETKPFVKDFVNAFKRMAGQRAGDNTWTDEEGKHMWRYIPGKKTLPQAREACAYYGMKLPGEGEKVNGRVSVEDRVSPIGTRLFDGLDQAYIGGATKMDWPVEGVRVWTGIEVWDLYTTQSEFLVDKQTGYIYGRLSPMNRDSPYVARSRWCPWEDRKLRCDLDNTQLETLCVK